MLKRRRTAATIVATGLALLALGGCGLLGSGRNEEVQRELNRNRRQWEAQGLEDYRYVARRGCFCPSEVVAPVVVEVRGGEVVARTYQESGEPVESTYAGLWPSLDGVFDIVQDAIDREAAQITVEYHSDLGYPQSIAIDYQENAVDEELAFTAGELDALPR